MIYLLIAAHFPSHFKIHIKKIKEQFNDELKICSFSEEEKNSPDEYRSQKKEAINKLNQWVSKKAKEISEESKENKLILAMDFNFGFSGFNISSVKSIKSTLEASQCPFEIILLGSGGSVYDDKNEEVEKYTIQEAINSYQCHDSSLLSPKNFSKLVLTFTPKDSENSEKGNEAALEASKSPRRGRS